MAVALFSPLGAIPAAASAPAQPAFCTGHDQNAKKLTFRWVALFVESNKPNYSHVYNNRYGGYGGHRPALRPGDRFSIVAHVTDCNDGANENGNGRALFEDRGGNGQRHDGPSPHFTRVAGNQYDGIYVAKATLFGHNPCDCDRIALKELHMGDRTGATPPGWGSTAGCRTHGAPTAGSRRAKGERGEGRNAPSSFVIFSTSFLCALRVSLPRTRGGTMRGTRASPERPRT